MTWSLVSRLLLSFLPDHSQPGRATLFCGADVEKLHHQPLSWHAYCSFFKYFCRFFWIFHKVFSSCMTAKHIDNTKEIPFLFFRKLQRSTIFMSFHTLAVFSFGAANKEMIIYYQCCNKHRLDVSQYVSFLPF